MKAGSQAEIAFNRDEWIGEKVKKQKYKKLGREAFLWHSK